MTVWSSHVSPSVRVSPTPEFVFLGTMAEHPDDLTRILDELGSGDESAAARLMPLVYDRPGALAGSYFRGPSVRHPHHKRIIHRDLEPANILIDESSRDL